MSTRPLPRRPIPLVIGRALRSAGAATGGLRRPQLRTLFALGAVLVLLVAGWMWLRNSSLVAVRTVEVSGVSGSQGMRIRLALREAARSMTTLHVREGALETAVAPFSLVKRIEVATAFPHTMRIHVVTNVAVGAVVIDGRRIAVTSDGTLLRDAPAPADLPAIPTHTVPAGARVTERAAAAAVAALGAAPSALRSHVGRIFTTRAHGLTIQVSHGPVLWFGDADRLSAKWMAVAAVLADAQAAGASTINVSAPERPAIGGLPDGAPATGESDVPTPPPSTDASTTDPTAVDPATGAAVTPPATP